MDTRIFDVNKNLKMILTNVRFHFDGTEQIFVIEDLADHLTK
jgi:hypothetical protein